MNLTLLHSPTESAIAWNGQVISYTRKIHNYESESDFSSLKTELLTYGSSALQELFDYLKGVRK